MFTMETQTVEEPEALGAFEVTTDAERVPLHVVPPAERHEHLIEALDRAHERLGRAQRELLGLLGQLEGSGAWVGQGARDGAHWVSMRYGVSTWKAHRLLTAATRLPQLPKLEQALATGVLGLDKTLELARFATTATEGELIGWARKVSCATVRRRGEVATQVERPAEAQQARTLSWWWTDAGARLGLEAELPAEQGSIVVATLQAMADRIPVMPDEAGEAFAGARRADALVALCSARGTEAAPERPTLVVHAPWGAMRRLLTEDPTFTEVLARGRATEGQDTEAPAERAEALDGCETEAGVPIGTRTLQRLLCTARIETVFTEPHPTAPGAEPADGHPEAGQRVVAIGRGSRRPPAWMLRQVRYRDRGCRFPGCGTRAFTEAHHVVWWARGGTTELDNLLLLCSFHHRLVHELGWAVRLDRGRVRWWRPDGTRHRAGPAP